MTFPLYTRSERIADGLMHALGVPASIAAAAALVSLALRDGLAAQSLSVMVYGTGLVATFACSAAYNLVNRPDLKLSLRSLDHCAIFLMIAGTYTPFAALKLGGAWGYGVLTAVWAIAVVGIGFRLAAPLLANRISLGLYLVQGWTIVIALGPLAHAVSPRVLDLLLAGGLLYTVGVVFHLWQRLPYQNAIWHAFVLAAAGCHYAAILQAVVA